ncbi:MAG: chemotaxis protein CheX [Tepidisphaeraceae bacterium]
MSTAQPKKLEIDPKLIVPFVTSVRSVLATMAGMETTVERPRLKMDGATDYDYSGIIGFSGQIVGTVVVSFHREVAIKLVAAFAGMEIAPDTSDFADAIGELANMIAGAAKKDLGAVANISVPSVVMGKGHTICRPSDVPCLVVPCKTAVGEFAVEVSIKTV